MKFDVFAQKQGLRCYFRTGHNDKTKKLENIKFSRLSNFCGERGISSASLHAFG